MSRQPETAVLPIAVELHAHLRWPSPINLSEDFASGTRAAAEGGYGFVADMPNTQGRPTWNWEEVTVKHHGIEEQAWLPMAVIAGSQPEKDNLRELEKMAPGCIALKIYFGHTTGNEEIGKVNVSGYEEIVAEWHRVAPDKPIMAHRGDADLEEIIDLIARKYDHPLHICHVNDPAEVEIVSRAKTQGLKVTCGVTPHHLFKNSQEVMTKGWDARMQPKLANQIDSQKLWYQLVNYAIDNIETDHAPHPKENKIKAELLNPQAHQTAEPGHTCYGVKGIKETMPQMLYQERMGRISMKRLVEISSTKPAEIFGVKISPQSQTVYIRELGEIEDPDSIYHGNKTYGRVERLTVKGVAVVQKGKLIERAPSVISQRGEEI